MDTDDRTTGREAIFLMRGEELVRMTAADYDFEDVLQEFLARYPELLGGGQITPDDPRRWILVEREAGVPSKEGGGSHWSLDHLFLDQDGIPTLVEVKRSSNRELRRMVVGQMLDYAANGAQYWPITDLIERFENTCRARGDEPSVVLDELLGEETDPEDFWSTVERNLRSGRLRLLFVADRIPTELQAIIEFLNEQMDHTQVLGVEIRQYVGEDLTTLVPRIIGQTATSISVKATGDPRSYEERLDDATDAVRQLDSMIQQLAQDLGLDTTTTKAGRQLKAPWGTVFQLYPATGKVELAVQPLRNAGHPEEAERLLEQITELAGHEVSDAYPGIEATALIKEWDRFVTDFLPPYMEAHRAARGRAS